MCFRSALLHSWFNLFLIHISSVLNRIKMYVILSKSYGEPVIYKSFTMTVSMTSIKCKIYMCVVPKTVILFDLSYMESSSVLFCYCPRFDGKT